MRGAYALVRGGSRRFEKVCRVLIHQFGVVQVHRTSSNLLEPHHCRCVEFFHMSSGWFDSTEPSLTTSLQGKQGINGCGVPELLCRVLSQQFGVRVL